ncbi:MAG: hypothetical protein CMQ15_10080 [Gammaproteobacteria bacterium]|nr:hypothetical protein [Gammaproteobacteria bacterium]|tara:strand:+ start:1478 stop:2011 length:534 start_codon:yes stop_codon:yes gene_type:complete
MKVVHKHRVFNSVAREIISLSTPLPRQYRADGKRLFHELQNTGNIHQSNVQFELEEKIVIKLIRNLSCVAIMALLASCAAPGSPGVGVWDVSIVTPVGEQGGTWTINADGTGIMGSDQGDQAIEGIMFDGNSVAFNVDFDAGGQSLSLSFSGTVEGDSLDGEFDSDFGAIPVNGTRQ